MKAQSGITLVELMVVLALAVTIVAIATAVSVPQMARQTMRSSLHTSGTLLRAARAEAIKRNRAFRFVVDLGSRTMSVMDTQGTASTADDTVVREAVLPSAVSVARPDAGAPITFAGAAPVYSVEFHAGGFVSSGAGEMVLCGGAQYERVLVYSAGGVHYERWNGSAWIEGS